MLALAAGLGVACGEDPRAVVEGPDGARRLLVHVQVARTAAERVQGLRGAESLAEDAGLWIAFPGEDEVCIVNEGVGFPIDALFVRADAVVEAVEAAIPAGDATPRCHRAEAVLEVAAGVAAAVRPGDRATLRE
ncbi:MAG TPA: DUF192 domain-containing protein [Polyangiaceae bacterium LLY-WYZ-15_(1-7)]|nr:DUF192 domain-containing protein [Polyangiaceae bacterium LLY-WYZ-15_(1-7)]HJL02751.1 DUF192 domain-containing protein [Polyangiaceae bacterium LLY-WYZ-15_(1-7)]HJL09751.1 DUF192 domain-containing protein [Polyangiaceae bacterium LLY-WYZ-15_(1-7)]HJL39269.1 DUF192 domain-containing protein [Polyangiaceae bacterium LLY-WYZ-15_(1-7)]HJL48244.1 DUF192 domain-containing protein [Polyangiaceae bacterium LLY-WYZ-15_(1-7)]